MLEAGINGTQFADALARCLLQRGLVKAADIDRAWRLQSETSDRLDLVLTKLGLVSDRDMADAVGVCLGLPVAEASDYPEAPVVLDAIDPKFLKQAGAIPLSDAPDGLRLAVSDPLDRLTVDALALRLGKPVLPQIGLPEDIEAAYDRLYGSGGADAIDEILDNGDKPDIGDGDQDIERLRDLASEAPVVRLVNHLIGKAVEQRASDVHIEPFEQRLSVRYRVDGVLVDAPAPPFRLAAALISRIKILAKLNIAESRLPQDGRIKLAIRGKAIDLRVSTVPTLHGESVVLRILDRDAVALDFGALGMEDGAERRLLDILGRPNGIVLVTGPTGSGKTTTLYTALTRLNTGSGKILTVEDPIEYQLDGINQVQVKPRIGLDFANLLRAFLRQDPDVIMIGEIRDLETAQIAVQAALTGHLVLSTLHTNNSASAITRLLDMGVDDYLIVSTLNGVIAQRLVRRLCTDCREPYRAMPRIVERLQLRKEDGSDPITLYRPGGCDQCNGSGYRGRTSIVEVLAMDDDLRNLISTRTEARSIQRAAADAGMRSMYQDGLRKAVSGMTTLEEVMRVTHEA